MGEKQIGLSREQLDQKLKKNRETYMETKIPEEGLQRMKDAMERAKKEKKYKTRRLYRKMGLTGMAASLVLLFLLPNCSRTFAQILIELPVVGKLFEVITIRDYHFDDGHSEANVKIPKVSDGSQDNSTDSEKNAIAHINKSVEEYTDQILERFQENQKILQDEGHQSLDISYEILTNTENWFTLALTVTEVQGSGYEYRRYYHIDKSTGEIATLKDLFQADSNYLQIISDYIQKEMEQYNKNNPDGDVFWIGETEFTSGYMGIKEDQNFYLNADGALVIVFDEYEVAPGYMGMPEFIIPNELIKEIRTFYTHEQ